MHPAARGGVAAEHSLLALNSGSSSLKFALFTPGPEFTVLLRGTVDGASRSSAIEQVLGRMASLPAPPLAGVGHRIVHGGSVLRDSQAVTADLLSTLDRLVPLAPNHLPDEIALIESVRRLQPGLPQVACFDTAFHADLPEVASRLPIAERYAAAGVRRYGFHGLSYRFLVDELRQRIGPSRAEGRLVLAHLGNGSSLAAVERGRSIDTSMGFTPIGGVVMSTRSGDLDPGVVVQMARTSGFDPAALEDELSHRSGLWAVSGGRTDMRELLAREADDPSCRAAVAIYFYGIKKQIGAYAAALGGLDVLVFSGGIGEHAPAIRARVCDGLDCLGVEIDQASNAANAPLISRAGARVAVHVIPTNEELVVARDTWRILHRAS
ncbi:MAG: acetate/propionate family kinase [Vicinamibacterales bacterium]